MKLKELRREDTDHFLKTKYMRGLILTLVLVVCTQFSFAQRDMSKVVIKEEKVGDQLYMMTGSGGNMALLHGVDGVFLIDDQFAPLTDKILAKVKFLTGKDKVDYLVNTHWHGDHTGGNAKLGKQGALILAHENVRERMERGRTKLEAGRALKPAPKEALPLMTFKEGMTLHLNGEDIMVFHVDVAHTDGDAIVYFPKSNVIHMGDTYFKGRYPYIDISSGGHINGVLKTLDRVIFLADSETKIIPGHGSLSNKKELQEYREVLMTCRDRMMKAIKAGQTLEEIESAGLTKEWDESWGSGFINPTFFRKVLFTNLSPAGE